MEYLTKEQILQADDLEMEVVEVPEWGGSVLVRGLTGTERDAFEGSIIVLKGKRSSMNMRNVRAKLVARSVVDEFMERLFSDADVEALGKKSAAALDRVFSVAQRLSGVSDDDMEELAENFESAQSADSTSD